MKYRGEETMWIRSQDKTQLVQCTAFSIKRNYGGKKKSAIMGAINISFWGRSEILLGLYDTKEVAQQELTKLQTELIDKTELYQMS